MYENDTTKYRNQISGYSPRATAKGAEFEMDKVSYSGAISISFLELPVKLRGASVFSRCHARVFSVLCSPQND
ncbi:hypothetical protein H5410_063106 [Solanum commersonii]|uniref:Uncharacterized protein n=1 Tax=Solanum commersonii TaxID=4109 RepID=A0A9J5WDH5_SOLCO|nr:hypothetical protein H5410_063106 [Solanum commersonii]